MSAAKQQQQQDLMLLTLDTNLETGLTSDQAIQRRESEGSFNVVRPPVDCPSWVCCLLPCIKHVPSMKAFSQIKPEDAEVLRNGKWIRYDAASLVVGDVIRLEEGDVVPADCVVVMRSSTSSDEEEEEVLVDLRNITGEEQLKSITSGATSNINRTKLYLGGKVVQGGGITAVITSIGPNTLLAKLIREKRFPPKEPVLEALALGGEESTGGIAMRTIS
jgi:hypothetical protein